MKLVQMKRGNADKKDMLDVVDALRADIEAGKVLGFSCVGFDAEDTCRTYQASCIGTTNLRMYGAIQWLLHCHLNGDV